MNTIANRSTLTIRASKLVGLTSTDNLIFLQRRGVTTTLHWGDGNFGIELITPANTSDGEHHLTVTSYTGGRATLVNEKFKTRDAAMKALRDNLPGYELAGFTAAYCHGWTQYPYQKHDVIISPAYYDGVDSVRLVSTNEPILRFQQDGYEAKDLSEEHLPKAALAQNGAFPSWIHDCDRKRGTGYCRQRIAWLVGQYLLEEASAPVICTLLQSDMTTPVE